MWSWIWPRIGVQPITQNTDSEMFDRTDYPYSETFVREAIQNTLDARLDSSRPALLTFRFHSADLEERQPFLQNVIRFREGAGLPVPGAWRAGKITWITVEDFNTKGLDGDLADRFGNFWGYWLNFGVSNKDGSGRGGRGIGRVTLLIASQLQSVIGLTRRADDGLTAACGMTLLKAMPYEGRPRSTHAYLASGEDDDASVYRLHEGTDFTGGMQRAFGLSGYDGEHRSGLALIIPYPHEELMPEGILASTIDHFAPAILNGSLVVRVDNTVLDRGSLRQIAEEVADKVRTESIRKGMSRYLAMLDAADAGEMVHLSVRAAGSAGSSFGEIRESPEVRLLQAALAREETVRFRVNFTITRGDRTRQTYIRIVAARAPEEAPPLDRLFREGMSLPDVRSRSPGDIDLIALVDETELATYLNFCEGKAHLDLLQSREVRSKLESAGYYPLFTIRNFVKGLPLEIRSLLTPEITEPETDVFDAFFAIPEPEPGNRRSRGPGQRENPSPPPQPPAPRIAAFQLSALDDGFTIRANPEFADWPVNMSVAMAYADGTRKPSWSQYDFRPENLITVDGSGEARTEKNRLIIRGCDATTKITARGFDTRRELDTRIRWNRDA